MEDIKSLRARFTHNPLYHKPKLSPCPNNHSMDYWDKDLQSCWHCGHSNKTQPHTIVERCRIAFQAEGDLKSQCMRPDGHEGEHRVVVSCVVAHCTFVYDDEDAVYPHYHIAEWDVVRYGHHHRYFWAHGNAPNSLP